LYQYLVNYSKVEEMEYIHTHGHSLDSSIFEFLEPITTEPSNDDEKKFKATYNWLMNHGGSLDGSILALVKEPCHPHSFPYWLNRTTHLRRVICKGYLTAVKWLLELEAKVDSLDANPLVALAQQRTNNAGFRDWKEIDSEIAGILLAAGANRDQIAQGHPVKWWAKEYGSVDLDEVATKANLSKVCPEVISREPGAKNDGTQYQSG
jgi:hypothetical protein